MPAAPDHETDLTAEQCRRIDAVFEDLSRVDHYCLLGVAPGSDERTIRRAYEERVREFHPDRFFRKRLGPYKAKLVAIFTRLEVAYDTLKSSERRAEYDAERGVTPVDPEPAVDPGRAKALEGLKRQLEARYAQARLLADAGKRALGLGDAAAALESYRKALALAPSDATIRAAHDAAKQEVGQRAAVARVRQAEREERAGHWADAVRSWEQVLEVRPDDANARQRLEAARTRVGRGAAGSGS
ncbi:MAG TPA: DnaJ domain-containing protein [Polyangiaceae bacterium]|nr:DnaJ domain-containing protein [Polyangiaceae bacterium]